MRRVVTAAMHEDVHTARPNMEHAAWVMANAKDLERAVLTGARADVLAVARCIHVGMAVDQPGRLVFLTDRELVKMVTAGWREKDAEAEADEKIVRPDVLILWLGSLKDGPKASPEILLDAIKVRREKRHATWLAHDPGRRCWIREQEAWTDVEEHLDVHYVQLEVPRILGKAMATANIATCTALSKTPLSSTTTPKSRALVAKVRGTCVVCGEPIEKGAEFRWADGDRNRAHLTCVPSP
ncbi:MAG: hypothetical protein KIT84_20250 [Labilithrix sp.]|nr:hypothetical protein [Labilithrix sp.]